MAAAIIVVVENFDVGMLETGEAAEQEDVPEGNCINIQSRR